MKKIFYLLLVMLLLVGCESNSDTETPTDNTNVGTEQSVNAQITQQVIFQQDDIKVTAKSLEYDGLFGPSIEVLIENNSDKTVIVQTRNFSINGIMIEPIFSAEVAAGKKANDSISLEEEYLELANITTIKDIEFSIVVIDLETWEDLSYKEDIKLTTDATSYVQKYDESGTLVNDKNDVKIFIKNKNEVSSFLGTNITVTIINNSDKDITVQARDVSINGFMIDPVFSTDVASGKIAYSSMLFMESDLKDNEIETITDMELYFDVFDTNTWDDIFETEVVNVEFNN